MVDSTVDSIGYEYDIKTLTFLLIQNIKPNWLDQLIFLMIEL